MTRQAGRSAARIQSNRDIARSATRSRSGVIAASDETDPPAGA